MADDDKESKTPPKEKPPSKESTSVEVPQKGKTPVEAPTKAEARPEPATSSNYSRGEGQNRSLKPIRITGTRFSRGEEKETIIRQPLLASITDVFCSSSVPSTHMPCTMTAVRRATATSRASFQDAKLLAQLSKLRIAPKPVERSSRIGWPRRRWPSARPDQTKHKAVSNLLRGSV